jgi:hypothetical protein
MESHDQDYDDEINNPDSKNATTEGASADIEEV